MYADLNQPQLKALKTLAAGATVSAAAKAAGVHRSTIYNFGGDGGGGAGLPMVDRIMPAGTGRLPKLAPCVVENSPESNQPVGLTPWNRTAPACGCFGPFAK